MKLFKKGILLILFPLAFEIVLLIAALTLYNLVETANTRLSRSRELITMTDKAWVTITEMTWQLLDAHTIGSDAKEKAIEISKRLEPDLQRLATLADTPTQENNVKDFNEWIRAISKREMTFFDAIDQDGLEIPFINILQIKGELKRKTNRLTQIKKAIHEEADRGSATFSQQQSQARQNFYYVIFAGTIFNVIIGALGVYFFRNLVSRIATVLDNSQRFSRGAPLAKPLDGKDEIADLDRAFHEMAGVVEAASARERAMIVNAVDVICSINEFGTFTAVSPAAERVWGYQPDQLIGKSLAEILLPDSQKDTLETLIAIRKGQDTGRFETKIVNGNGGTRDMQWSAQWSQTDATFFCVVHDISDRKAVERLKQDFVNMISHDLKTPLTAVRLTLELVLKGVYGSIDAKGEHRIAIAQDSTNRLLELINQLLQLEKLEAGKMELAKTPNMVLHLLQMSSDSLQAFAEQHIVKVAISCPDSLEAMVDGDRIVQVVINLLSNAIKFSPPQTTITLSAVQTVDQQLLISVQDQGRGVPEHLRASIFDRFKQVERADSAEKGGTGLGLAICQAIVQAHDGEIGVDSEEGKGSTFWFKIPIGAIVERVQEENVNVSR